MSMLWSAQYLRMSERIVTPVLENEKILVFKQTHWRKLSTKYADRTSIIEVSHETQQKKSLTKKVADKKVSHLPTPALQCTKTGVFLFFPAATWHFLFYNLLRWIHIYNQHFHHSPSPRWLLKSFFNLGHCVSSQRRQLLHEGEVLPNLWIRWIHKVIKKRSKM